MKKIRKMIEIDEQLCNGCGDCMTGCPEGALRLVDGKARLVSETYCDGLGACIGKCPVGAIHVVEREADAYDERKVMTHLLAQEVPALIDEHLDHLREHGETEYLAVATRVLAEHREKAGGGCPGSAARAFGSRAAAPRVPGVPQDSALTHWPVQMHLLNPLAPHFQGSDFLLAADCVAFALGNFHRDFLQGRTLGIACPKLDEGQEIYRDKLQALVEQAGIKTLTVMIMQVPCCRGLLQTATQAVQASSRKIPVRMVIVGIEGGILREEVLSPA